MINVKALSDRLRQYEDGQKASEFSRLLWKPKEGVQKIRIVPYAFNPENPLIELQFYYNLAGKHYLAPSSFGKPDPIQEVIDSLRASGSDEEKEIAKKLSPTTRIYTPIIVRGEEELGVRYWGFGTLVHKQLLKLMTNPEWGDITSYTEGNDIEVDFKKISGKKNMKTGQPFPETTITALPRKTPVVDPTRRDLMEKVKSQTDILKIFPLKSYEDLKAAVEAWLNPDAAAQAAETPTEHPAESVSQTATPAAATVPLSVGGETATGVGMAAEFEKFFQTK